MPLSRLIAVVPFFRISMDSRVFLGNELGFLSSIFAFFQLMVWLDWAIGSIMADLCYSMVETFLWVCFFFVFFFPPGIFLGDVLMLQTLPRFTYVRFLAPNAGDVINHVAIFVMSFCPFW